MCTAAACRRATGADDLPVTFRPSWRPVSYQPESSDDADPSADRRDRASDDRPDRAARDRGRLSRAARAHRRPGVPRSRARAAGAGHQPPRQRRHVRHGAARVRAQGAAARREHDLPRPLAVGVGAVVHRRARPRDAARGAGAVPPRRRDAGARRAARSGRERTRLRQRRGRRRGVPAIDQPTELRDARDAAGRRNRRAACGRSCTAKGRSRAARCAPARGCRARRSTPCIERLVAAQRIRADDAGRVHARRSSWCRSTAKRAGRRRCSTTTMRSSGRCAAGSVRIRSSRSLPPESIGGSTYTFDVWPGHPLYEDVLATLGRVAARAERAEPAGRGSQRAARHARHVSSGRQLHRSERRAARRRGPRGERRVAP